MANKVLIVDDVNMFLELERGYLQLSAVNILTAKDGKEALRICRSERPTLVFMDLHMPVMDGAECCRAIKKDSQLRETSVVLITSESNQADRTLCIDAGCDEFLTKPLDRRTFLETARRLLPAIDRRDKRIACRLKVKYRAFGVTLSGVIENISQNGIYLATDFEVEKGAELELMFALPDPYGSIIQVKGRAAWTNSRKAGQNSTLPEGLGVEFISLPDETARELGRFIDGEI